MNYNQMQEIANKNNLGVILFINKTAYNTGQLFEVGYVFVNKEQTLFCKRQPNSSEFYLCNEFRELENK